MFSAMSWKPLVDMNVVMFILLMESTTWLKSSDFARSSF